MRWRGGRESANVEDRRSFGGRGLAIGGGASLILALLYFLLGGNPSDLTTGASSGISEETQQELKSFVSVVLAQTEDVWHQQLGAMNRRYVEPRLVLFAGQIDSACGTASSAVGPFYCPLDQKVYLDLEFFEDLRSRFGAPGDFAQAYVIAHEVGHHVQTLLGTSAQVRREQERAGGAEANRLSVRLELQADFYAGVYAHYAERTKRVLEPGDIEEALRAASAIGDDRLQREARGRVVPDSFTHGTSAQRVRWFRRGYDTGDPTQGDTFAVRYEEL